MISFFVPGTPVPQGRPRAFRVGNSIGMFDPKKSKEWKKTVAQVAGLQPGRFQNGALKMTLRFNLPFPKSMKIISWSPAPRHTKRGDLDNYCKSVCDALNEVCYKDDSQICELVAVKRYVEPNMENMETGVHILIEELV